MKFLQSIGLVKVQLSEEDLVYADLDGIRYVKDSGGNVFRTHSFDGNSGSRLLVSLVNNQAGYINGAIERNWKTYQEYFFKINQP